jgi:hypothetical protein
VLTDWIFTQASRVAPSPFSRERQDLITQYAPPHSEVDRQFRELALVVGYSLAVLPAMSLWGLVGWLTSGGGRPSDAFVRIGWALLVVLLTGLALHLIRYYDGLVHVRRARTLGGNRRWPRASTDLDFVVQIAVGAAAAALGAPG